MKITLKAFGHFRYRKKIEPKFSQVCYFNRSCHTRSVGLGHYCLPKVSNGFKAKMYSQVSDQSYESDKKTACALTKCYPFTWPEATKRSRLRLRLWLLTAWKTLSGQSHCPIHCAEHDTITHWRHDDVYWGISRWRPEQWMLPPLVINGPMTLHACNINHTNW